MLKIDKIRKAQNPAFYVIDYLWGGFASLGAVCFFIAIWQVASEAYAPHLIERLLPAIYVAVSNGAKVLVMAELLGANNGIGAKIAEARVNIDTVEVMAYVCLVIAFTALFDYLVTKPLEILLMPWSR